MNTTDTPMAHDCIDSLCVCFEHGARQYLKARKAVAKVSPRWLLVTDRGETSTHCQLIEAEGRWAKLWNAHGTEALRMDRTTGTEAELVSRALDLMLKAGGRL